MIPERKAHHFQSDEMEHVAPSENGKAVTFAYLDLRNCHGSVEMKRGSAGFTFVSLFRREVVSLRLCKVVEI